MKIILANDYKNIIGGTEVYMYSLKEELERRGHIVKIYGSNLSIKEYIQSQQTKPISRYIKKLFNLKVYFEFKKLIQEFKPDIIHLNNIYNELSPSIILASGSVPIVLTVHDTLLVNAVANLSERTGKSCKTRICTGCMNCIGLKGMLYERVRQFIYRLILKKVKLFITPSQYMRNFMIEARFKHVRAIHNGIKLPKYSEISNYNNLLYVGRLSNDKGIEYLLKAMPQVIRQIPNVHLKLIGDGPNKNYFEHLAIELNIQNNTTFVGSVNKDKIYKYYQESTLVVVPSIFPDNFPTVCIEALAIGRPVLGSKEGGIPELVEEGNTGFIVPSKDVKVLTEKIIDMILNKSLIHTMSKKSNEKSVAYSIDNHVSKIETIYQNYLI